MPFNYLFIYPDSKLASYITSTRVSSRDEESRGGKNQIKPRSKQQPPHQRHRQRQQHGNVEYDSVEQVHGTQSHHLKKQRRITQHQIVNLVETEVSYRTSRFCRVHRSGDISPSAAISVPLRASIRSAISRATTTSSPADVFSLM